ncbi:MAG: hypothetical protein SO170_02870 [Butyribacter sp.]|nr:hypothetical protein [bacterium]MDY3853897.1 hypothetical protein [Butyribacter sp.]
MKRNIKWFMIILSICVLGYILYCNVKSNYQKKDYANTIDKAIQTGEMYRNEPSDTNRTEFIKELKDLVVMYAGIRDGEEGDKAYNAKMLCDFLSSSYDILEVDKNQVCQLSSLLDALQLLKSDPFDESGRANDCILDFVKANP